MRVYEPQLAVATEVVLVALARRASNRGIDLHEYQDWWVKYTGDDGTSTDYMTDIGRARAVRMLKEDRWKSVQRWLDALAKVGPIVTGITGLVGALIGLLALLRSD
jgi:hypothetical protein